MKRLSAPLLVLFLAACSSVQLREVEVCDTLYFGTEVAGQRVVGDGEWRAFLDEIVAPRFPGFTTWSATGFYQREEEPTYVLAVTHPDRRVHDESLAAIVAEYKRRFRQEGVFWTRTSCLVELPPPRWQSRREATVPAA